MPQLLDEESEGRAGRTHPRTTACSCRPAKAGQRAAESWSRALFVILHSFNCPPTLRQEMGTQKTVNQQSLTNSEARVWFDARAL